MEDCYGTSHLEFPTYVVNNIFQEIVGHNIQVKITNQSYWVNNLDKTQVVEELPNVNPIDMNFIKFETI